MTEPKKKSALRDAIRANVHRRGNMDIPDCARALAISLKEKKFGDLSITKLDAALKAKNIYIGDTTRQHHLRQIIDDFAVDPEADRKESPLFANLTAKILAVHIEWRGKITIALKAFGYDDPDFLRKIQTHLAKFDDVEIPVDMAKKEKEKVTADHFARLHSDFQNQFANEMRDDDAFIGRIAESLGKEADDVFRGIYKKIAVEKTGRFFTSVFKTKKANEKNLNAVDFFADEFSRGKLIDDEIGGYVRLLQRFHQIILQGPPGTGKTYTAKKIIARLIGDVFDKAQGKRWDIVQFHPSYNYEDFVRGIQIQTEGGQVVYNSVNRILAEMAERAAKSEYPHALIIDEINRANVASVLGELIYALEYRGEAVKTPYAVDDSSDINLPENLYIIGTMNTADRTIGHLDYAVRRRFAFQTLLPNRDIVSRVSEAEDAAQWFDRVADFFQKDGGYLSPDFYREDVAVGHSYFLADDDSELRDKIRYQVIPILSEYLKDGVLLPEAAEKIEELRQLLAAEIPKENGGSDAPVKPKKFAWQHIGHGTSSRSGESPRVGRLILHIIKDYVQNESPDTIAKVRAVFPVNRIVEENGNERVRKYSLANGYAHNAYFIQPDEIIRLSDGTEMVVSREWGATGEPKRYFDKFCTAAEKLGYLIEEVDE